MSKGKTAKKQAIIKRDGGRCLCCGTSRNLTVDHVVPKSKGGLFEYSNLQTLCFWCNQAKGDKIADYRRPKIDEPTIDHVKARINALKLLKPYLQNL